jgi:hypothetical protein
MTDTAREFRLGPPADDLGALAEFLKAATGADVAITVEPDRPLATPELQLLLAAGQDPAGPFALTVGPQAPRLVAGLALLGLAAQIKVAA